MTNRRRYIDNKGSLRYDGSEMPSRQGSRNQLDDPHAYSRNTARSRYSTQRKGRSRKKTVIITVVAVFVTVLIATAAAALSYLNNINNKMHENVDENLTSALTDTTSAEEPFYMLLLGTDESAERDAEDLYGGAYRSDSILLARIDPQNQEITLISIHRDTLVNIPGHGENKINAAYAYGGPELMIQTVSEFAGVDISHYAEIDITGFISIVDQLGGVDVDVPESFYDPYLNASLDAGYQTLTGDQAIVFCRARHAFDALGDGDVYRAAHQRLVLTAIAKKLLSSDVGTITSAVNTLSGYVTTDLDVSTILSLALSFRGMDTEKGMYSAMSPTSGLYQDGVWYEESDTEAWTTMMQRVNEGLSPEAEEGETTAATSSTSSSSTASTSYSVVVKNGAGISGVASEAADVLESAGYTIAETGDADASDYAKTLVIYSDSSKASVATEIADALGCGTATASNGEYSFDGDILVVVGQDWS